MLSHLKLQLNMSFCKFCSTNSPLAFTLHVHLSHFLIQISSLSLIENIFYRLTNRQVDETNLHLFIRKEAVQNTYLNNIIDVMQMNRFLEGFIFREKGEITVNVKLKV
jgi:hypothetical protein